MEMDIEKAIAFTDTLVSAKAGVHLSDLQQAMLRESWSWQRQSYDKIADTYGYSPTYLKHDVGPKLWKLLSEVLGEKVNKTNFRAAIERRFNAGSEQPVPPPVGKNQVGVASEAIIAEALSSEASTTSRHDWGEAIDVSLFYGRQAELAQLEHWLMGDRCRLIALLGMGGMGKTSLSVKLARSLQDQFEWIIWRSLHNAPPLPDLLTDMLHVFSHQQMADSTDTLSGGKLSQLLHYLRSHRCLLILDNVETILSDQTAAPTRRYREGYESYGQFFRQIGETIHQSCLILTSREKPHEVSLLEGATLPVRSLPLSGLDRSDGQKLFELKGSFQASQDEWNALVSSYSGNPLALKIIATTIQNLFDGDISAFLQQDAFVFGSIRNLIEQQVERLSNVEKTVMYWLAIYREPATFSDLRADIVPAIAPQHLIEALESLEQRTLVEKYAARFSLQPVVMEYVTDRLVKQVCRELQTDLLSASAQPRLLCKTHALLKAHAQDYIRDTQIRLILHPILNELQMNGLGEEAIATLFTRCLAQLQGKPSLEVGYAGGNLLNLWCQQKSSLENYDFSHLTIWQAYLPHTQLRHIDFSHSDLSQSVFAETLGIVFGMAFSPNGVHLATGDAEGGLRLWDVATGTPLLNFEGHAGWVWSVAFSADGQRLASCSSDKTIRLWDVSTGDCLRVLQGHTSSIWSVAFSADGQTLASGGDEPTVRLWDVSTGQCHTMLSGHTGRILAVTFHGQQLASSSDDGTVRLWDMQQGPCLYALQGHTDHVWSVAFNADGTRLASGSADRTIRVWDTATGHCVMVLDEHSDRVRSVKFSPDDRHVISGSDDQTVRIWDLAEQRCVSLLRGHTNSIFSISVSADGQAIASSSADQTVRFWNLQTGRCVKTLKGYTNSVFSVAFESEGQTLASASTDHTVRLWDIETGTCLRTLVGHTGWVTSVAFQPTGHVLASSSADQTVKLWDVMSGTCLKTLRGHSNWVQSVAFSPDGETLISGGDDRTIRIWSVKTGECLQTLKGHTGWVWAIAISSDGDTIASSSEDQTVRLWSMKTGTCLKILDKHTSRVQAIAFSPDGQTLSSASNDETVRLWSVKNGKCLKVLEGHSNNVWSVAFRADGAVLASSSLDQTIRLWNVKTGTCTKVLAVLNTPWRSAIAFSTAQQEKAIATGSQGGMVKLWHSETGECLQTLIPDKPYTDTNITGVTGITTAQRTALKALGAIEM
ncbi:MAG TPA: NB-ARC domain-containing protein [Crinalium sp.]